MGCTSTKQENVDSRPIMVRYTEQKLNMPFSSDTENSFEKEIFFAINLLRNNPRSFIPHVQRVHQKNLCKGSKSMGAIIQKLKNMVKVTTVKFEDKANTAVRQNNAAICGREEDSPPEDAGNLAKLNEITGQEPTGAEATFYNYGGSSAEEFVALLLYKDFDKFEAMTKKPEAGEGETGIESPLLNNRTKEVGISNKAHSKCLNSIQIIYIYSLVNNLNAGGAAPEGEPVAHGME